MESFARDKRLMLPPNVLAALRARYAAARCDDAQTLATIKRAHAETGRLIDPHTAVALHAAYKMDRKGPVVVLSTADAAKFPDAVAKATGVTPPLPERLKDLFRGTEKLTILPNDRDLVRAHIEAKLAHHVP